MLQHVNSTAVTLRRERRARREEVGTRDHMSFPFFVQGTIDQETLTTLGFVLRL